MYDPNYNYNDKLVFNLVKIEHNKTVLGQTELGYNLKQKLLHKVKVNDLLYFSHLLKLDLTIKQIEKILAGTRPDDIDELRFTIIKNTKSILDFNRSNIADTYNELDIPVILHINKLMLNQWKETWEANFRSFNGKVNSEWDDFLRFYDDTIPVKEIENEVISLVEWYKYSIPTVAPLIRIAVAAYRLIQIAPFNAVNKFTIICIIDFLLLKNGFGYKTFMSTFRMFDLQNDGFIKALEITARAHEISYFINFFLEALNSELVDAREEVNEFILKEEKEQEQPFLNLNKRQLKVLKYLQTVPTIKREDYCHMMDVSTMTAFRDLNDLVRKKLLKIEGRGRGTKYKLVSM